MWIVMVEIKELLKKSEYFQKTLAFSGT